MSDRFDNYFKQILKDTDLNNEFGELETADWNMLADLGLFGLITGGAVTPSVSVATATVGAFTAYGKSGQRLFMEIDQDVDFTMDSAGNPTVPSSGNFKWISLVARYGKFGQDPVTDGDGATVYFQQIEGISSTGDVDVDHNPTNAGKIRIVQGTQAGSIGAANRPAVSSPDICIVDLLIDDTGKVNGGLGGVSTARTDRIAFRFTGGQQTANFDTVQYVLLEEHCFDSTGVFLRRYIGRRTGGGPPGPCGNIHTTNARWDGVQQLWFSDSTSYQASLVEDYGGTTIFNAQTSGATSWVDTRHNPGGWDSRVSIKLFDAPNGDLTIDADGTITSNGPQTAFMSTGFFAMPSYPIYPGGGGNELVEIGGTWPQVMAAVPSSQTLVAEINQNLTVLSASGEPDGGFISGHVVAANTFTRLRAQLTSVP